MAGDKAFSGGPSQFPSAKLPLMTHPIHSGETHRGFQLLLQHPSIPVISSAVYSKRLRWVSFPPFFTFQLATAGPVILCGSSGNKHSLSRNCTQTHNTASGTLYLSSESVASARDAAAQRGNCFHSRGSTTSCYSLASADLAGYYARHDMEFAERISLLLCSLLQRACVCVLRYRRENTVKAKALLSGRPGSELALAALAALWVAN